MNSRSNITQFRWLAGAGTLLSLLACYGTLGLIAILSLMGVSLAINEQVWAGVIVTFALIAVAGVALGYRLHRNPAPAVIALAGALLVIWAMYGSDNIRAWFGFLSRGVELAGFAGLIAAAVWDWRLKRIKF
jgi:Na+/H+-dicarboxylate symporter